MRKYLLLLFIAPILFSSCRKEMEKASWDTDILTPLVNASMTINNILPDSILQANPDSSLKIVFNNDLYKIDMDTLFNIGDTTIHNGYALPGSISFSPGQDIPFPSSTSTTYTLPGIELKTVIIKLIFS